MYKNSIHLSNAFLAKLDSEINRYIGQSKKDQIDELFKSPISWENVVTQTNINDQIILLNNHLYTNTELETLTQCPITRKEIKAGDKLDVTNEIKNICSNYNLITPPPTHTLFLFDKIFFSK